MREKLTVIKVGGKIVEEEATLLQLLNAGSRRRSLGNKDCRTTRY